MAKNHKKPSPVQQLKLQTAHHRKDFYRRFAQLLIEISGKAALFKSIPAKTLEMIYLCRVQSVKTTVAAGCSIKPDELKELKETMHFLTHSLTCSVNKKGGTITLAEFLTTGLTLTLLYNQIEQIKLNNSSDLIAISQSFRDIQSEPDSGWETSQRVAMATALMSSKLNGSLYWGFFEMDTYFRDKWPVCYISFKVFNHDQVHIPITIDGITRPAVQVGWGIYPEGVEWCKLPAAWFGLPDAEQMLSVYIQMHALNRLEERIDCADSSILHYLLYNSVIEAGIIKGTNNHYLIPFNYFHWKAGYFVAIVQNDKLVIRTFLFLTNNGTPEGAKLEELTGLQKLDRQYLLIDKLSTFMNTEFRENEIIRKLFDEAGCGVLFEIPQRDVNYEVLTKGEGRTKLLMDFLKVNRKAYDEMPSFADS